MNSVTVPAVTLDADTARKLKRAGDATRAATVNRDHLIVEAHQAGASLREIAQAVGLTHVGVKKIIDRALHRG